MVLIHVQVALASDVEVNHTVLGNLLQHVVEEAEASLYVALAVAVQADTHLNVRLLRGTLYACCPLSCKDEFDNLLPSHLRTKDETAATEILSKLLISLSITNNKAASQVVVTCHIVS